MTADPTARLREALAAEVDNYPVDQYGCIDVPATVNAILASLVEHRDDVLDVLGMEQVGWFCPEHGCIHPPANRPVRGSPVYAFRPKEQHSAKTEDGWVRCPTCGTESPNVLTLRGHACKEQP